MANITTFGTLKSEILAAIGRAPADFIYQIVTQEINRDMRIIEMQATTTLTSSASITLPSTFIEIVSAYRDVDPRTILTPTTPDNIHSTYETSGNPSKFAIVDDAGTFKMLLNRPGSGTIEMRYYAELALMSADEDTNEVLTEYPGIFLYGSLYHHAALIGDERLGVWGQAYERAKKAAQVSDTNARIAGAPVQPQAPGSTP